MTNSTCAITRLHLKFMHQEIALTNFIIAIGMMHVHISDFGTLEHDFDNNATFMEDEDTFTESQYIDEMFKELKLLMNDVNATVKKIALICEKSKGGWLPTFANIVSCMVFCYIFVNVMNKNKFIQYIN